MAAMRRWVVSKLDVKGVFLSVPLPPDELILVQLRAQWVTWGIVQKDVVWKLNRVVYGLRQSPKSSNLRLLTRTVGKKKLFLAQNEADTQVWSLKEVGGPAPYTAFSACT